MEESLQLTRHLCAPCWKQGIWSRSIRPSQRQRARMSGLWRVYQLTYPSESRLGEDPRIADIVYGMFERAARYAQKYESGHRRVLQLCLFSDGELAETAGSCATGFSS